MDQWIEYQEVNQNIPVQVFYPVSLRIYDKASS